jgi:hypothetical protein
MTTPNLVTDEMVETGARALAAHHGDLLAFEGKYDPDGVLKARRQSYRRQVRAVLGATAQDMAGQVRETDREATAAAYEGKRWILRDDGQGDLDEVVAHAAGVHLERMGDNNWWLGIQVAGEVLHVSIGAKRATVTATASEDY